MTVASFGIDARDPILGLRCDRQRRIISIGRKADASREVPIVIRTETATRQFSTHPAQGSVGPILSLDIPANDRFLDAIALTRGRFAVEAPGLSTLYLPAWGEVTRVIEDCR
ncbi:hypothetical protein [Qipengyuania qiaonensis]|nr:hypothetical protein [Qipengyuania qiaonensis]